MHDQNYIENAIVSREMFFSYDAGRKNMVADAMQGISIDRVLDIGCGAGQNLIPFAERKVPGCFGIDIGAMVGEIGRETFEKAGLAGRGFFFRASGEVLPFADASFDAVLCGLALPYMDNRAALAEIARVVRPGGYVFLKTHHPGFYLKMIGRALNDRNPKAVVYPALCLIGGTISVLGRRHPRPAFFRKREVFQTDRMLDREFKKNGFRIVRMMPDSTAENRSYLLEKL